MEEELENLVIKAKIHVHLGIPSEEITRTARDDDVSTSELSLRRLTLAGLCETDDPERHATEL